MKIDQFPDNHQIAYKVTLEAIKDITAPQMKFETVTRRKVREMFQKFIQASPELWPLSREDQIREFNLQRRAARRPLIALEILKDLEFSYTCHRAFSFLAKAQKNRALQSGGDRQSPGNFDIQWDLVDARHQPV